ncbi:TIGR03016 family PEP-CTERM system-associated outer membrane protein [Rhodanobacter denitrificans]|uniref:TIGR03016 family PEP-CTERM system-associated outer membrane protein n=1 Tax=Rhodanobacter denitrificans TaxID=666685 RepID=A0A368KE78_9GAMM|nr:TIGR03016 family PEP-CTERM system-associated outer membrane protein [Rhodanobacter denitrificans]RCS30222.1 TIGR03016 family PEP-CTERM system-associated outer membrane protein [Rhodanobacter denitrificans]
MRALSTSAVLSSIVLGGWLTGVAAQSVNVRARNSLSSAPDEQATGAEDESVGVGVIPQPSIDSPGTVLGVTLGELYTDNLRLAASAKPKQTGWITEIQPFFKGAWDSPRFSGVLDYTMTGYLYAGQSRSDQLAHDLRAGGTFVILPQHFFLDGTALYGREVINNELPAGSGTFFLNNNLANVARGTLSPYWIQDFDNVGTMTLRYTLGRVVYNHHGIPGQNGALLNGIPDNTSNALQFGLVSPEYQTWGWNLGYSDQRFTPDYGRSTEYAVAKLGAAWQISNDTKLLADAGKENRFLSDGTSRKLGAVFWDVGFDWSDIRDDFKFLVGHRFYGRSYQFSWTRTAALLTTTMSYVEQPTDLNQQLLEQNPGAITVPGGIYYLPSLRNLRTYLMKRAAASASYTMPRGSLRMALYDERRTYFLLDNRDERVANANLDWLFDIGASTTLTTTLGWQRYKFQDGQINHNHYAQLTLVHQVSPNNFGSLRLRRDSRNVQSGAPEAHGYRVNVLFVQWTHLF